MRERPVTRQDTCWPMGETAMSGETFESLLTPALPAIRQFVRAKIRMRDHAEDVVQQALMHAFAHREQLRVHSKFKSWIVTIALNEIRGLARRTRVCVPLESLPPLASSDASGCPYEAFEAGERGGAALRRIGTAQASRTRRDPHVGPRRSQADGCGAGVASLAGCVEVGSLSCPSTFKALDARKMKRS